MAFEFKSTEREDENIIKQEMPDYDAMDEEDDDEEAFEAYEYE